MNSHVHITQFQQLSTHVQVYFMYSSPHSELKLYFFGVFQSRAQTPWNFTWKCAVVFL